MRSGTLWSSGLITSPLCLTGQRLAQHKSIKTSQTGPECAKTHSCVLVCEVDGFEPVKIIRAVTQVARLKKRDVSVVKTDRSLFIRRINDEL